MSYAILLPLAAVLVNAFTWVYAMAQRTSRLSRAFQLVAGCFSLWCLSDLISWSSMERALWLPAALKLHGACWLTAGFLVLHFGYVYLERRRDPVYYACAAAVLAALPLHLATDWFYAGHEAMAWGQRKIFGPAAVPLIVTNLVLPAAYALFLGARRYASTNDEVIRGQLRQLLGGGGLALLLAVLFEVVLHHLLGLHDLPQLGASFSTVFTFFIYRAVAQHDLMAVSIDEAAIQLFDSAEDGLLLLDGSDRISLINPTARALLQVGPADERVQLPLIQKLDRGDPEGDEVVVHRGLPQERTLSVSRSTIGPHPHTRGRLIIMRDVTGSKLAEEAVRRSEERYRRIFNSGNDALFVFRLSARGIPSHLVEVNDVACRWFGYTKDELYQLQPRDLVPLEQVGDPEGALQTLRSSGKLKLEVEARTKGDELVPVELVAHLFELADKPAVLVAMRDVSARRAAQAQQRRLQEQLLHAQKMEAVGTLAGGMAHDMNNVLGTIMSLASILMVESDPDDPHQQDIEEILASCRRGRELTQNLLSFARKGPSSRTALSLGRHVDDVRELLLRTIPKKITVRSLLDHDLLPVEADPDQITHVLINVCLNAVEALQGEGQLTLEAHNVTLGAEAPGGFPELAPGSYVRLRVSDTGSGMDEETRRRAFEPFFSTKPKDKGTGLGLAMVYSTVSEHGGAVSLESAPGQGTSVTILLPATELEPQAEELAPTAAAGAAPGGVVLLVDDEEMIRGSTRRLLEALGYEVSLATSGEEALALYREQRAAIVLVLLDLMMPQMDGEATFRALQALNPGVRVLLSSGHAVQETVARLLAAGARGFVPKPYAIDLLADEVTRALADPQAPARRGGAR